MSYENQLSPGPLFLARKEHPQESHAAARYAEASGAVSAARARCLGAIRAHPGSTISEMELADGVLGRTYGRRANELIRLGVVRRGESRRCTVTGRICATWYPWYRA